MSVDHVDPAGEARRMGISPEFYEDSINLVLCCAGCIGFGNRNRRELAPRDSWTLDDLVDLRDAIFAERFERIATRRRLEIAQFESRPWLFQK
jgi:hypothetical protein